MSRTGLGAGGTAREPGHKDSKQQILAALAKDTIEDLPDAAYEHVAECVQSLAGKTVRCDLVQM